MIKEIAFIAYRVTDIARAREFYEGSLGLAVSVTTAARRLEAPGHMSSPSSVQT